MHVHCVTCIPVCVGAQLAPSSVDAYFFTSFMRYMFSAGGTAVCNILSFLGMLPLTHAQKRVSSVKDFTVIGCNLVMGVTVVVCEAVKDSTGIVVIR